MCAEQSERVSAQRDDPEGGFGLRLSRARAGPDGGTRPGRTPDPDPDRDPDPDPPDHTVPSAVRSTATAWAMAAPAAWVPRSASSITKSWMMPW
ncbi:hypothetical protein GCM10023100_27150 [Actinocorallia cavernae]|uniref:Uncharacterized protein n=2 Tax=Actinomycetes TaxID=1760 RepID=A0ABP8SMD3_9ACTN